MSENRIVTCTILAFFAWLGAAMLDWSAAASLCIVIAVLFLLVWLTMKAHQRKARQNAGAIADTWQEPPPAQLSADYEYFVPPPLGRE